MNFRLLRLFIIYIKKSINKCEKFIQVEKFYIFFTIIPKKSLDFGTL